MLKIEKFDDTKTYMFVDGSLATPEKIIASNPAITTFTHVLELNGEVVQAVMNLTALRNIYNLDETLSEDEACAAIEVITNTPQPVVIDPTERLAAAQEFSNLMLLTDVPILSAKQAAVVEGDKHAELIKENYNKGLWNNPMVEKAVTKGALSANQKNEIIAK